MPKRRARRGHEGAPQPATNDPVEIAMGAGPEVAEPARALLVNQNRLVQLQIGSERLEQAARRITIALKLLLGIAGLAVAAAFAAMVWEAANSRGLVIDSFQVPPSFAAQGLTGEVVASKILDRLTEMRANTDSSRAADTLEGGWREAYRVEIPQTGIDIGEIRSALRRWLGDDTRVSGELVRTESGLAFTVRTDRGASATFTGAPAEIDRLAGQAAADIYAKTAPYLAAWYLWGQGREDEALAALLRLAASDVDEAERAWALSGIGYVYNNTGRCAEAMPILERSMRLDPNLPNPVANLSLSYACLGRDQQDLDLNRRAAAIYRSGRASGQDETRARRNRLRGEAEIAALIGDHRTALERYEEVEAAGMGDTLLDRAGALASLHDVAGSRRTLSELGGDAMNPANGGQYWSVRAAQAMALDDWAAVARHGDRMTEAMRARGRRSALFFRHQIVPYLAVARARGGDPAGAQATLAGLPGDCRPCAWARAEVAEARGDRADADRWFGRAAALGPRLPHTWEQWGRAKLARGDAAGALPLYDRALALSPAYADAHKGRGDALAGLGRLDEALASFAQAAERAPRWGALHLAWARALWRLGRQSEAREKLRAAAAMDLSRADRERLGRMWTVAQGRAS